MTLWSPIIIYVDLVYVPGNCWVAWLNSNLVALTCAIGTDVPMGTVRLPTVLLFVLTDHTS